jgi:acetyl-CoA acetyltransferase
MLPGSGSEMLAEPLERCGMATGLVSLVELSRQFRQRGVGGIDLEVVLNIGVGGPGAAAVVPEMPL